MIFPSVIAKLIGEYAALWQVAQWVTNLKFPQNHKFLCSNSMAMDVIDLTNISWNEFCENPADWAVDILLINKNKIEDFYFVAYNTNKRAFQLILDENIEEMHSDIQEIISANPNAIEWLRARKHLIYKPFIMWNPAAKDLIMEIKIPICYDALVLNPADWAVDLLLHPGIIEHIFNIKGLSSNTNHRIVTYLLEHSNLIHWPYFSGNPTAIKHLRMNPQMVTPEIYLNSQIFEPTIPIGLIKAISYIHPTTQL